MYLLLIVIIPIEIIIGTITPISIEFTIISSLSILTMLIVIWALWVISFNLPYQMGI
jgi:hypothetical protein